MEGIPNWFFCKFFPLEPDVLPGFYSETNFWSENDPVTFARGFWTQNPLKILLKKLEVDSLGIGSKTRHSTSSLLRMPVLFSQRSSRPV